MVNDGQKIIAISIVCTHLGCTPNWMPNESKFKCPCHGSGFTMQGVNFEGPAPVPLRRYEVSLAEDGQIVVNKGRLFMAEKGEFDDPRSFIAV
jgi:cytochrome b6-f complex iron-sulfur subunit